MRIIFILIFSILTVAFSSRADVTTDTFPALGSLMGSVGIENFQHNKFSGAVTYSIPLEVAPGTSGIQPQLVLRYFSGNGNSSAGVGWNIDLGRITRSLRLKRPDFNDSDIFILQLNDTVSELVGIGNGEFRTKLESYLKITKSGSKWAIIDRDGTKYEYNYNAGELNYYLTKVTDTHGNFMEISYISSDYTGYIETITYTKGNDLNKYRTVEFHYEGRSDTYPDNASGRTVRYNYRVDYIDVLVEGSLYKRYDFTYTYSPNSSKSLLKQVDEIAKDANSRLKIAEFNYAANTINFDSARRLASPAPWDISDAYTRVGDINGDGFPDLFKISNSTIQVALWQDGGWGPVKTYGFPYSNSGTANIQLGDVNGDGRDDIIRSNPTIGPGSAHYQVWFNTGDGWNGPVVIENTQAWNNDLSLIYAHNQLAFVNNDKYIDIVQAKIVGATMSSVNVSVCYGNGSGWNDPVRLFTNLPFYFQLGKNGHCYNGQCYNHVGCLADLNGDGLADFLCSKAGATQNTGFELHYMLADGSGWDGQIRDISSDAGFNLFWLSTKVFDINKDGFADLVCGKYDQWGGGLVYKCHLGNGQGFGPMLQLNSQPPWKSEDRDVLFFDCDKDGVVDCLKVKENSFTPCRLEAAQDDLLKEVINRYGGKTSFYYKNPRDCGGSTFPFSLPVLYSSVSDPGIGVSIAGITTYAYDGGSYDTQNKIFRGFRHVQVTDPLNNITHLYYHQDDSRLGKIERQENAITRILNTYKEDSSAPYFTPLIQSDQYTDSKCRRTAYEYDDYGNVIKTLFYGDSDVPGDERVIFTDYSLNTSSWLLNLPSRERVFSGLTGTGTPASETQYFYDNNSSYSNAPVKGDLTAIKRYLNTMNNYIQATSAYDAYGNEITKTDANGNVTKVDYDSTYHAFPVLLTNAKGQPEKTSYYMSSDPKGLFGQIKSKIDPNGNETGFEYDGFGRKTKISGPYDLYSTYGSESYEYGINGAGSNYILTRTTEVSGTANHLIKIDILDGFERVIQTGREGKDANIYSYITTVYNPRGEIDKASLPYFKDGGLRKTYHLADGAPGWTQYSYDAIGRITSIIKPDSGTINNSYDGWNTAITDENGHQKTFIKDAYGLLSQVKEKNGSEEYSTTYKYDCLDDLVQITDHPGNKFEFSYDTLRRRTKMVDPDLGTWNYDYDNNGNLVKFVDGSGQVVNFTYDALNRMITKDYSGQPGIEVTYSYDEASSTNGIGRRTGMKDLSGSSQWQYDLEGRVTELDKTVGADNPYVVQWSYDAMNRIKSIIFPNLKEVKFTYNNAGLPESIDNFVLSADYNASTQPAAVTFSNNFVTRYGYYPENQRLKSILTGSLQDLTYAYDKVGNIVKITDAAHSYTKDYAYDGLDRLVSGDGNTYEYNAIGNIMKANGAGQSYHASKIHALTNDGKNSYAYDTCGNMTSGAGRSIAYDPENRPVSITKDGSKTEFIYDGDGKRVKKTVTNSSLVTSTVYIEDLYEKETNN